MLEESLLFIDDVEADQFIRFMKSKDCRTQKRREGHVVEDILMRGSVGNLIAMLEEMIAADPESYGESTENDKLLLFQTLMEPIEEEMTSEVMIPLMLAETRLARDYIADVNTRFNEGDVFATSEFSIGAELDRPSLERMVEGKSRDEQISSLGELLFLALHLKIMKQNNLIQEGPDGVILRQKMNPDDVSIEYRVTDLARIDIEVQNAHHLSLVKRVSFTSKTRVLIDPSLYCICSDDELLDAIAPLSST
ncbi:hypothetical protein Mpal_0109 [Methanosphaerula palustris E1-9c]|uniref:Uncharacterized protein n=1 Tax=Methanosphaerula palustris (strain ATCC BAA-1556 / DSM 19958 / E1-9c) TaxID=521011 RepID=B8GIF1_METPE|nr:hypothetical protein Mpal_0109 [Methanosphaerula palustris E1-9c]